MKRENRAHSYAPYFSVHLFIYNEINSNTWDLGGTFKTLDSILRGKQVNPEMTALPYLRLSKKSLLGFLCLSAIATLFY